MRQTLISFSPFILPLRTYAAQLSSYRSHCDSILNEVEAALRQLQDLKEKHLLVSTKTGALHEACEQLLQDQVLWNSYWFIRCGVRVRTWPTPSPSPKWHGEKLITEKKKWCPWCEEKQTKKCEQLQNYHFCLFYFLLSIERTAVTWPNCKYNLLTADWNLETVCSNLADCFILDEIDEYGWEYQ